MSRTHRFRGSRNTTASLQNLKQTPAKANDNIAMRRALQKQNQQARITSRAITRIRGGTDL